MAEDGHMVVAVAGLALGTGIGFAVDDFVGCVAVSVVVVVVADQQ